MQLHVLCMLWLIALLLVAEKTRLCGVQANLLHGESCSAAHASRHHEQGAAVCALWLQLHAWIMHGYKPNTKSHSQHFCSSEQIYELIAACCVQISTGNTIVDLLLCMLLPLLLQRGTPYLDQARLWWQVCSFTRLLSSEFRA